MRAAVHLKNGNQFVRLRMLYNVVREYRELHDQQVKDLHREAQVFQTKRNRGSNESSGVSPFLHECPDSCVNQRFNTTEAKRAMRSESTIPVANVICGVIQRPAIAWASGPNKAPRAIADPRIPIT